MTDYYQSQLHNIGDLSLDAWKNKKKLVLVQRKSRVLSTILFVAAVPVIRLLLSTIFNKSSYTLLSCSGTIRHCSHFHLIHSRTMYVFLWSQSNLLGLADRASFRCHNSYHTDMVQMFPRLLQCSNENCTLSNMRMSFHFRTNLKGLKIAKTKTLVLWI